MGKDAHNITFEAIEIKIAATEIQMEIQSQRVSLIESPMQSQALRCTSSAATRLVSM